MGGDTEEFSNKKEKRVLNKNFRVMKLFET
jgi:hypothetical protein